MSKKRVIWINGGSRGIGLFLAKEFSKAQAKVIATYSGVLLDDVKADPEYSGIDFFQVDCTQSEAVDSFASDVIKKYPGLDVLVNCAGIGYRERSSDEISSAFFDVVNTNLIGKYHCIRAAVPFLSQSSYASIINLSSASGTRPAADMTAYCSAAAGIIMMTRCLAQKLSKQKIRVNCISPSMLDSGMSLDWFSDDDRKHLVDINPSGRLCTQQDIFNCVKWLCSEEAEYINGENILLSGG